MRTSPKLQFLTWKPHTYQEEKLGIVSNKKLEGIRIREVEGRGRIRRKSAQRVKQPKEWKSGEKTRTMVSRGRERERERERKTPTKLFYSSPISFHLSRTKFSPCVFRFGSRRKRYQHQHLSSWLPWAVFHTGHHFFRSPTGEICHLLDRAARGRRAAGKILVRVSDWSIVRGRGRWRFYNRTVYVGTIQGIYFRMWSF